MDAVEFLKEKERMCRSYNCESCVKCPCEDINNGFDMTCEDLAIEKPEAFVAIIEKWSAKHPVKTRQSEFLEMFPDAKINSDGVIDIAPCFFDKKIEHHCDEKYDSCDDCYKEYWLSEIG